MTPNGEEKDRGEASARGEYFTRIELVVEPLLNGLVFSRDAIMHSYIHSCPPS
jgi:hypothetical protein